MMTSFRPGLFRHDGVVWAYWGANPKELEERIDDRLWKHRKLSEYYAAKEDYDVAKALGMPT